MGCSRCPVKVPSGGSDDTRSTTTFSPPSPPPPAASLLPLPPAPPSPARGDDLESGLVGETDSGSVSCPPTDSRTELMKRFSMSVSPS